jgi:hypothetical protein
MGIINKENVILAMNTPAGWKWVLDPEDDAAYQDYNDPNEMPPYTPEGHWEWIPSPQDQMRPVYDTESPLLTKIAEEHRGIKIQSKGMTMPLRKK